MRNNLCLLSYFNTTRKNEYCDVWLAAVDWNRPRLVLPTVETLILSNRRRCINLPALLSFHSPASFLPKAFTHPRYSFLPKAQSYCCLQKLNLSLSLLSHVVIRLSFSHSFFFHFSLWGISIGVWRQLLEIDRRILAGLSIALSFTIVHFSFEACDFETNYQIASPLC